MVQPDPRDEENALHSPARVSDTGSVPVWDPVVRIFHWVIVAGVVLNYALLDAGKAPHRFVGYVVAAALAVRVAWGFVGSAHARFSSFVVGPRLALSHLASIWSGRDRRHVGHNPAGGLMIVMLMTLLMGICATGWMQGLDAFWGVQWVEMTHAFLVDMIIVMAALHVTAGVVESVRHRENLVLSMITGRKRPASGSDIDHAASSRRR
ncbi:cytochrome b/b6 domain-containing protein [Paraburkholderia mimosarum]|uniref:cytochrome b/b6 domain-containing protein n=1 Tax=Paraburkholderia mimosarum TaxID=312026 RepID=UPI000484250E|nr:cytochrome b/b6 domain-containing protein [Paraburkholderia mimosarum]